MWFVEDSPRLSRLARRTIMDADRVFLSRASAWEIAIKFSLGKLPLKTSLPRLLDEIAQDAIEILEISNTHLLRLTTMPHHHGDPFDRMILAQALEGDLPIVGSDKAFDPYGVRRIF